MVVEVLDAEGGCQSAGRIDGQNQGLALGDTEAVLFIDDDKAEIVEAHAFG